VSAELEGLSIGTSYHFRFIATNSAGTTHGTDETFATFGVKSFSFATLDQNQQPFTQAGGHPYELTATFSMNLTTDRSGKPEVTDANPKDVRTELPPGLIGNPEATPKCAPYNVAHADCSGATQVGILKVFTAGGTETESPIYNLAAPAGMAAQFGARFNGFVTAHIDAKIRTGGDYGVTADSLYLSADEGIVGATTILWGVPSAESHDLDRFCPSPEKANEVPGCYERGPLVPFLTNPTSCLGPQTVTVHVDSWQDPGAFVDALYEMPATTGCEKLDFSPTMTITPTSKAGDSASGLNVELKVPQNVNPVDWAGRC
jgi:hypothetical protein